MNRDCKVLIVGAGPTGLVLAIWLTKLGISPRIIDNSSAPGQASRAIAVQARTLEFYQQIGLSDEILRHGIKIDAFHLCQGAREVAKLKVGDFGQGLSPFPFVLSLPQDDHERLLVAELKRLGVEVEWNTTLIDLEDQGGEVLIRLHKNDAEERSSTLYLCGCDGANSTVRQTLKLGFSGGTYEQLFYVADVKAKETRAQGKFMICLGRLGFGLVIPVRTSATQRLIGIVPHEVSNKEKITFEDIRSQIEKQVALQINEVNWFSTYHIHHRVAEKFKVGRVFIAGDAAHIHSPAGGQGMNTGIGDAVNLSWKLAQVLKGQADETLLETYEVERIKFAKWLVTNTDRAFQDIVSQGVVGRIFREFLLPYVMPSALKFSYFNRAIFCLLSQIRINYRHSNLSLGKAGHIQGGDRLPWVETLNNFSPLKSLSWQLHIYGRAEPALTDFAKQIRLPVYEFNFDHQASAQGLKPDAMYLVRPDGYVALAEPKQNAAAIATFFSGYLRKSYLPN